MRERLITQTLRVGLAMALAIASLFVFVGAGEPSSAMQANPTPEAAEFLRIARKELAAGSELSEATTYLRSLPLPKKLPVASTSLNDDDARIGYLSANILIEQGKAQQAVPGLSAIISTGRNETQLHGRMGYDWVHSDDESLFLRMTILINKYLLANLARYRGDQRARVEATLMGGLLEKPSQPFSKERAEKLIIEWQGKLSKQQRESRRNNR